MASKKHLRNSREKRRERRKGEMDSGLSWADQWDNNPDPLPGESNDKKKKDGSGKSKLGKSLLSFKWMKELRKKSQEKNDAGDPKNRYHMQLLRFPSSEKKGSINRLLQNRFNGVDFEHGLPCKVLHSKETDLVKSIQQERGKNYFSIYSNK
ncbi:hypothetical protein CCACVL1_24185 [Corchorus capsularis]|uniref:Uncharacterized protein n=1 Tax=Corchorus capsularis TaxID=210143 RepID=A0A1R3GQL0_COCAP|nr:hypothetical protein CCACVL1_24185 [Corchorus capsularis]